MSALLYYVFKLVQNATLGVLIKDMKSGHIERDLDGVACASGGSGGYASGQLALFTNVEVQINFSTHQLGYVYVSLKGCTLALANVHFIVKDTLAVM